MSKCQLNFANFIKPVFRDKTKNIIVRAGRQSGKTYGAVQKAILTAVSMPEQKILWVDTIQGNIKRYIDEYFRKICGGIWGSIGYDRQSQILTFINGSKIYFGSAERPENLEGFSYDLVILNEAGIILKKEGLWLKTIQPMTKNAQTYFIGTPKGKTENFYYELSLLCENDTNWKQYHFSCYDSPFWNDTQLEAIKRQVPSYIWLQEYLAEFVDVYENSLLDYEDLRFYEYLDINQFENIYIHADTTHTGKTTSDYFCLVAMGENTKDKNFYILDFILDKLDPEKQARQLITMYSKFGRKVKKITFDEKANQGFGYWTKELAKKEYNISLPLQELKYNLDKIHHFTPHIPHFKANRVYFPSNHSQLQIALDQLLAFPSKGINDDFVDGLSGCLDNFVQEEVIITIPDYEENDFYTAV